VRALRDSLLLLGVGLGLGLGLGVGLGLVLCAPSATVCFSLWWKGLLYGTPDLAVERRRSDSLAGEEGARACLGYGSS
jgi:hypothetical protein